MIYASMHASLHWWIWALKHIEASLMPDSRVWIRYEANETWKQSIKVRLFKKILNLNSLQYVLNGYFEMLRDGVRACQAWIYDNTLVPNKRGVQIVGEGVGKILKIYLAGGPNKRVGVILKNSLSLPELKRGLFTLDRLNVKPIYFISNHNWLR